MVNKAEKVHLFDCGLQLVLLSEKAVEPQDRDNVLEVEEHFVLVVVPLV